MGSVDTPLATIGILSIGDMGSGIARILIANNFKVVTNATDRSQATQTRAQNTGVHLLPTDTEVCNTSDYILSIVPPRDVLATAERIITATSSPTHSKARSQPLYFLDLNAMSPNTARKIHQRLQTSSPAVIFIDGGIIGGPPELQNQEQDSWYRPSIPLSGPHRLDTAPVQGSKLAEVLNVKFVNESIGAASGLKMCFASLAKGYTALAIQSFTTAYNLGVLEDLKSQMKEFNPSGLQRAERGLPSMCPKAYRWVQEMREIAETFEADGGFEAEESPFRSIAGIYDLVAHGTLLGKEVTEQRVRGKSAEDVAALVSAGTAARKEKTE